jgi:hypothetical protein
MKFAAIVAALAAALFTASAPVSQAQSRKAAATPVVISAGCLRGPWKAVIIDRPSNAFVDSLTNAGYDYATAFAIAERICRDPALVDRPEELRAETLRVINAEPPRGIRR